MAERQSQAGIRYAQTDSAGIRGVCGLFSRIDRLGKAVVNLIWQLRLQRISHRDAPLFFAANGYCAERMYLSHTGGAIANDFALVGANYCKYSARVLKYDMNLLALCKKYLNSRGT